MVVGGAEGEGGEESAVSGSGKEDGLLFNVSEAVYYGYNSW